MTTDDQLRELVARSVEVVAEHQHVGGAYLASPTFRVYRFSWLRDGAFIADAMSRAGATESADRFFGWCGRTISARATQIDSLVDRHRAGEPIDRDEHPPTRYSTDGADSGEEWWDFQLDGYGAWMWALAEHRRRHHVTAPLDGPVASAVDLCTRYLAAFWDQPCFDWWEEHPDGVHTSTLAAIHAGLAAVASGRLVDPADPLAADTAAQVAARIATDCVVDGHLVKMIGDRRVDASLIAASTPFGTIDPSSAVAEATYARILTDLAPDGVHRYLGDTYFGGGRWVVLAGFVGMFEAATGRRDRARDRLRWMWHQATDDGLLPEQTTDHTLDADHVEPWIRQWGPVATPLLWSHAMYISLADSLDLVG